MAEILCITSGLTGIVNASFELVARLQAAGHQCTTASPKLIEDKVRAQGFNYLQLDAVNFDPAPPVPEFQGPLRKVRRWLHKWLQASSRKGLAVKALGMDAFLQKIQRLKPQLIIIDVELHEHIMALVSSGHKVVLLSQWFSLWNRKGLPPLSLATIPGVGAEGSEAGMAHSWKIIQAKRKKMFAKKRLLSVGTDRRSILERYAQQVGFSMQYIRENYWPGPFTYGELPVISMTSEFLEFPHDERPNHTYVGPMVYEQRVDVECPKEISDRLTALIKQKQQQGKKLIYCSVSTFRAGDVDFIQKTIAAVTGQTDWLMVIGLGGQLKEQLSGTLPENVIAFDFIPQLQVLQAADLSINHGGIHTINECMHFEVPMLVYSGKRSDQNGCAARVHYHGVGIMADKDVDSSTAIRDKIATTLANGAIREKIGQVRQQNNTYRTDKTVEQVVENYLVKEQP